MSRFLCLLLVVALVVVAPAAATVSHTVHIGALTTAVRWNCTFDTMVAQAILEVDENAQCFMLLAPPGAASMKTLGLHHAILALHDSQNGGSIMYDREGHMSFAVNDDGEESAPFLQTAVKSYWFRKPTCGEQICEFCSDELGDANNMYKLLVLINNMFDNTKNTDDNAATKYGFELMLSYGPGKTQAQIIEFPVTMCKSRMLAPPPPKKAKKTTTSTAKKTTTKQQSKPDGSFSM